MENNWDNDRMCFVCGKLNDAGFKLDFVFDAKTNELSTKCVFDKKHQGFKDVVHGGFIAMVLDEVMVNLSVNMGLTAGTAEMAIRLKRPAKVGEEITFIAKNARAAGRLVLIESLALTSDGATIAQSAAKLFKISAGG